MSHRPVGIAPDHETALRFANESVDLALVDINLRDGETGPKIGQQLAATGIMVIFATGNPRAVASGVAGTLGIYTKPLNRAGVASIIDYADTLRDGQTQAEVPSGLFLFGANPD